MSKKETVSFLSEHLVVREDMPLDDLNRVDLGTVEDREGAARTLDITSKQVTFQLDTERPVGSLQAKMGQCHVCCRIW